MSKVYEVEESESGRLARNIEGVRLVHSKGEIVVKEADLVAVSLLMHQRQSEGRLPSSISLEDFTPECVLLLANYIKTRTVKAQVSFFTIAEVLKLTKAFLIEDLGKRMEEVLIDAAMKSPSNLLLCLLVNDVSPVSRDTEMQLHYLAAWRFMELARLSDFAKLPPTQFLHVFSSCELRVPHELTAVDVALLWLTQQPDIDILAPAVFYLVRSTYLGKPERQMIIERCHILNFNEGVIRAIKACLESRHSSRICITPDHIHRHLVRCGVAEDARRPPEIALPMSRPREGLVRPKLVDKKNISRKSSKKGSSKSQKSAKSLKSGKYLKSQANGHSAKSQTNERSSKSGKSQKASSKSHKLEGKKTTEIV